MALGCGFLLVGDERAPAPGAGAGRLERQVAPLASAGGLLGVAVAGPLRDVLAPWGAGIVLTTLVALSVLVLTATPVRAASDHLAAGVARVGRALRRAVRWVASLTRGPGRHEAALRHPTAVPGAAGSDGRGRSGRSAAVGAVGVGAGRATPGRLEGVDGEAAPAAGEATGGAAAGGAGGVARPGADDLSGSGGPAGVAGGRAVARRRRWRPGPASGPARPSRSVRPRPTPPAGPSSCRSPSARPPSRGRGGCRPSPCSSGLEGRRGRPAAGRGARPDPRGRPGRPRRRDPAGRHDRRPDGDPLRARARSRGQGGPGDQPPQGHRLRHGVGRRADPGAHPRPLGHRRRGARTSQPPARRPGRHPGLARGPPGHPPARGGDGARHRRAAGAGQPGRDAPHPHRRRHRGRQVVVHQLADHLDPDAGHPRPGAPHPGRPQAGRARPVQRPAAPAHPGRGQPEEGRQRPVVGRPRDGAALRPAGRGRRPGHHRLQRRLRPRRPAGRRSPARSREPTSGCRSSWSWSTSSTTS